ncbi:MAG: purine-nucleoside phosphorylase [Gammaproteobacteria bacterium RIFCSPHIGHO2_12_FULL_45_9]|nr:MAG: purine-nucleoside phosphorylase [Gammaproteobacteria bacterium RIFCSPHIGHO2_12_FULL_45_9]
MTTQAIEAAEYIQKIRPNFTPRLAIVLGSGLGGLVDQLTDVELIPYECLPGFHKPAVAGHGGMVWLGYWMGVPLVCFQGRAHFYEGIDRSVVQTMVRTAKWLGADTWIATNAAGSLDPAVTPGQLVVIRDHLNFQGSNPLVGPNDDRFGPRFVSMDAAYDAEYRERLQAIAAEERLTLREGVYAAVLGPMFETPAEIRAFRLLGADLVGMSTVGEVITARHCGMRVTAISVVTNLAAGLNSEPLSHEETLAGAALGTEQLLRVMRAFVVTFQEGEARCNKKVLHGFGA